ncbi:MAG: UDP-N-acetylmuramate:L-alanyl-gamma-D-glutamyl-meso-diaminopimelate ligase [Deltaproteobacteria bacterium]|nr:MAG: UDP-N-acetylmuramate:L-alanyl-gamma-D-glutamyl-meso-diaminopimelate ligase [Deltaproteobacteria bacterium]
MPGTSNFYPLSKELNTIPKHLHHIHLMGICGTAMASLAGALKEQGYKVTGSDRNAYPPMSLFLEKIRVPVLQGFKPENLDPRPDLVVVGNVVTRENPEAKALAQLHIPFISLPQALNHFVMKGKKRIVIAGTHGKTTTSSLAAWVLEVAGMDPGFMIGGIPRDFDKGLKLGNSDFFVVEGDEYDTAFFDKGPKFFHYNPWALILTSIEYDHADIYDNLDQLKGNFLSLIQLVPGHGCIIANAEDPLVMEAVQNTPCLVYTYGMGKEADCRLVRTSRNQGMTEVILAVKGGATLRLYTGLYGKHNLSNLMAVVLLSQWLHIPQQTLKKAAMTFSGVKRRQEVLGEEKGILVLDDFAHHPTAVKETIRAVKEAFPERRLIAVFEPRSNSSRRNVFQAKYTKSFDMADLAMIPEPPMMEKIPVKERFSSSKLVQDLQKKGIEAYYVPQPDKLLQQLLSMVKPGDTVLFMSNGDFDNLPHRFLKSLRIDPP